MLVTTGSPSALAMHPDWDNSMLSPRSLGGLILSPMPASSSRYMNMLGARDMAAQVMGCSAGDSSKAAGAAAAQGTSNHNWRFVSASTMLLGSILKIPILIISLHPLGLLSYRETVPTPMAALPTSTSPLGPVLWILTLVCYNQRCP